MAESRRPHGYLPARYRRRRALAVLATTAVAAGAVLAIVHLKSGPGDDGSQSRPAAAGAAAAPTRLHLVARESPASLPAPLSGEALAATGGALYVMGGLDSSDN